MPRPIRPAILDVVTSRNATLLTRAARFAMGNSDYLNVRALELVSEHPRLVEIIEEQARVEAAEAASMVRSAVSRFHLARLEEFIKLAGVVRERVQRAGGFEAGGTDLCDLNEYCWNHIRKYLSLADVVVDSVALGSNGE
ncbi:hypothetical protein V5799_015967 [Amblyomma americanum]|uniref:Uncharacterized protein n=1 Tax=Amblyomma americanum TaxID=6943 RepID=A0AAQ4F7P2_AMBAM